MGKVGQVEFKLIRLDLESSTWLNWFTMRIFLLMLCALTSACSTVEVMTLNELGEESDKTTFLLAYDLVGSSNAQNKGQCSIQLTNQNTQQHYQLALNAGKKALEFEVPEGVYQIQSMFCDGGAKWELNNFGTKSISAFDGKANFLGHFVFRLSYHDKIHELSMNRGNREDTRAALLAFARTRSSNWKARVVSSYRGLLGTRGANGQGWDLKYLESDANYKRGSISHVVGKPVHLNPMDFMSCEKSEFNLNPVPLGMLSYKLDFENNRLIKSEKIADKHTFTDAYVKCVEDAIKKFEPGTPGKVTYDLNL